MDVMTRRQREALRKRFLPSKVRLLFVGESPPASGRFFYSGNSGLYRAMREAFRIADRTVGDETFLAAFRARGCYLTDLSHEPVDDLDTCLRRAICRDGEKLLAREIARRQPAIVAPVVRSISGNVESALKLAKWEGELLCLPYPGRWISHRETFVKALVPVIRRLRKTDCMG
jgi:hypothetical protein